MKSIRILAPFAFAFVAIVTGCSGAAPEDSALQSSELKAPPGKKEEPSKVPSDKEAPPAPEKSEPSETPEKKSEPGKDVPPSDSNCFVVVEKAACQSDDAWKNLAAKICDGKGYSLSALSTSDDCKGGSTVAKIECCQ